MWCMHIKIIFLLFSKQAEIDRKKAEVRARLEAQAGAPTIQNQLQPVTTNYNLLIFAIL